MPTKFDLSSVIAAYQVKTGRIMTIEKLAEETGISKSALYRLKSGESSPSLEQINIILKILGMEDVNKLIIRTDTKRINDSKKPIIQFQLEHAIGVYQVKTGRIMSIAKLAEKTGIDKSELYQFLDNEILLNDKKMVSILDALGIELKDLTINNDLDENENNTG
ncbi:MAG: helix-turn-helix domain-containing protein [Anaerolineae bacterium]|nr:helix-turn-helix domain-containing protein [Anaerolineae bacterium]